MRVCATTANLPGFDIFSALKSIHLGLCEPFWGVLSVDHVQICPQNPGILTDVVCQHLMALYPQTRFRLHANARVLERHVLWDLSSVSASTEHYFKQLAHVSSILNAPGYSLHAGYRENCSLEGMLERYVQVQEWFGDIPVAIEGLYPSKVRPQLMESWKEYKIVFDSGANIAIDFSHLQIVAKKEGHWDRELVEAMVTSSRCLEIHVSENNGQGDQHRPMLGVPDWIHLFSKSSAESSAVCFSEGRIK